MCIRITLEAYQSWRLALLKIMIQEVLDGAFHLKTLFGFDESVNNQS